MKPIFFLIIALLASFPLRAQNPSGRAYSGGIYVFCGADIPHHFRYVVEKKNASGAWERAAELRAPASLAALKANLLGLPASIRNMMPLPLEESDFIWERQRNAYHIDSLYAYRGDPKVLAAVGCGWFDDGVAANGTYHYRVSKVNASDVVMPIGEFQQQYPQENAYSGTLYTMRFVPDDDVVTIYYGMTDTLSTYNLRLYRSRLQENDYRETPSVVAFSTLRGRTVAVVSDETVTKGLAYSYVAIPYDALGNMGTPSDTISIYNLSKVADIGFPEELQAVGDKAKKGVALTWKIQSDMYVLGYGLYRSKDYDGDYTRIAMLPRGTTSYFDSDVDPAKAYYYFVTVHNGYGNSLPSARVPVILEGDGNNIIPPQNVEVALNGNVVQLTFNSIDADTRGYRVYRGEGYTGALSLIASFAAGDSLPSFTDTLALSLTPQTYTYAVADVNTSNRVSPMSERVSVQFGGGMLSAPSGVEAQLRDNEIFVVWEDMEQVNVYAAGYNLYRSITPTSDTEDEPQLIATLLTNANSYIETNLIPGAHYRYSVETIDINGETSGRSQHAGVTVPRQPPLPPGQVSAIATTDRILLRWDNPYDASVETIRIYRAATNVQPALIKELPPDQNTFEDQTAVLGEQYFYFVVTVNGRGEESRADEPVSGRIRE